MNLQVRPRAMGFEAVQGEQRVGGGPAGRGWPLDGVADADDQTAVGGAAGQRAIFLEGLQSGPRQLTGL